MSTIDNPSTCSICYTESIDNKVNTTCSYQHSFCFSCILHYIQTNNGFDNGCPNCRGGDKFILINNNNNTSSTNTSSTNNEEFYTIKYFYKSIPILKKISNKDMIGNSCIISYEILLLYIANKSQIEITNVLLNNNYILDDIIKFIKFNKKNINNTESNFRDIVNNIANEFPIIEVLYPQYPHQYPQYPQYTQYFQNPPREHRNTTNPVTIATTNASTNPVTNASTNPVTTNASINHSANPPTNATDIINALRIARSMFD